MEPPEPTPLQAAAQALTELFSQSRIRRNAHFRYREDGPTELEREVDAILEEVLGAEWSKKQRR